MLIILDVNLSNGQAFSYIPLLIIRLNFVLIIHLQTGEWLLKQRCKTVLGLLPKYEFTKIKTLFKVILKLIMRQIRNLKVQNPSKNYKFIATSGDLVIKLQTP